ncbi:MAG: type VI secretion system tip protein VgrG [Desulfobacteraceae bacterium]|nr:type VI secretion system tip protein VgrG [Desulfobacteraceae bacterium]MBC2719489.1 type VI secretion system tip protein VgrG [Desulfobacteraceae bacterium]
MSLFGSASKAQFLFEISGTKFKVVDFSATETISSPYNVDLNLALEDEIDFDGVIAKEAVLTILGKEEDRYFHGIISQFVQTGSRSRFYLYQAKMAPSVRLLSFKQDCRIFQDKSTPDIVGQILKDGGIMTDCFEFRLQNQYQPRKYCVQYCETDLDFISRLLEEEGIFYFFEHAENKHLLVFGDGLVNYQPIAGETDVLFHPPDSMVPEKEFIRAFALSRQIQTGQVAIRDFNFERPSLDLTAREEADSFQKLEVYDYPGEYSDQDRGKRLAKIRLQETVMFKDRAEGESCCPRLIPGFTFNLTGHMRDAFNQEYLLDEIVHTGSQPQTLDELAGSGAGFSYANNFFAIPSSVTFRPERKTPKLVVQGAQTAMVVGPDSEEIYADKYGRVKVQFHWDREGEKNEKSSCWIRVASSFAGGNYGSIFIPRIGHEVIVEFVEGDPDRPVITGCVYNANTMPPYTLPDEKTKSAIKTNSSPGGEGFNEIRFEDANGNEEIFIHAEKNMDLRIKNNRREWIGNDRHLAVQRDKLEIVEHDKHIIIKQDELQEIERDRNLKIEGGDAIGISGSRSIAVHGDVIKVFKKKYSQEVAQDYYVKGDNIVFEGMTGLCMKVGDNFITLNSGGVFIKGTNVLINSGGSAISGTAGNIVAPAPPLEAEIAGEA